MHFGNCLLTNIRIITARNEVWGKVIFSQVSVILLIGGVCLSACWDTPCQGDPLPRRPPCQGDPLPGPHPRRKLRENSSRPTPKGEIEGDQDQPPSPQRLLLRAVRILLECIFVIVFNFDSFVIELQPRRLSDQYRIRFQITLKWLITASRRFTQ